MNGYAMHPRCLSRACFEEWRIGRGQLAVIFRGCDRPIRDTKFRTGADGPGPVVSRKRFLSMRTRPKFARIEIRNSVEYKS